MIGKSIVQLSIIGAMLFVLVAPKAVRAMPSEQQSAPVPGSESGGRTLVSRYCVVCHNERNKARVFGFVLSDVDPSKAAEHPEVWEKVLKKMRGGLMPPSGSPRPTRADELHFMASLEAQLDRATEGNPDPGRTAAFRRLNRTEYANVI